jgi:hypothetical protein
MGFTSRRRIAYQNLTGMRPRCRWWGLLFLGVFTSGAFAREDPAPQGHLDAPMPEAFEPAPSLIRHCGAGDTSGCIRLAVFYGFAAFREACPTPLQSLACQEAQDLVFIPPQRTEAVARTLREHCREGNRDACRRADDLQKETVQGREVETQRATLTARAERACAVSGPKVCRRVFSFRKVACGWCERYQAEVFLRLLERECAAGGAALCAIRDGLSGVLGREDRLRSQRCALGDVEACHEIQINRAILGH